jgi:hypothetical protein
VSDIFTVDRTISAGIVTCTFGDITGCEAAGFEPAAFGVATRFARRG